MTDYKKIKRRDLLKWTAPVVTAVALPAHAQTSVCTSAPILAVVTSPKCAGFPPIGTALIEISTLSAGTQEIKAFNVTTSDPNSDLSGFPSLPYTVPVSSGATITWQGPASDAVSCLPLASISLEIEYSCDGGESQIETYDITSLLINSIN